MSSNHNTSSFFSSVSSANLPGSSAEKSQPWSTFHQADESLAGAKSIVVDVPTSDESGSKLGRVTQTGSLGGTASRTGA